MLNFHKQQLQMLQNSIAKVTQAFGIKLKVLKLFHAATEARYKNLHHYSWTLIHHQVIRLFLGTFSFTWNGHVPYLCKPPRIEWHSGSARRLRKRRRRREISEITLISRYRKQTVHVIHYHYKQPIETHTSVHDDGKLVSFFLPI